MLSLPVSTLVYLILKLGYFSIANHIFVSVMHIAG